MPAAMTRRSQPSNASSLWTPRMGSPIRIWRRSRCAWRSPRAARPTAPPACSEAESYARKAIDVDPALADAFTTLGVVRLDDGAEGGGDRELEAGRRARRGAVQRALQPVVRARRRRPPRRSRRLRSAVRRHRPARLLRPRHRPRAGVPRRRGLTPIRRRRRELGSDPHRDGLLRQRSRGWGARRPMTARLVLQEELWHRVGSTQRPQRILWRIGADASEPGTPPRGPQARGSRRQASRAGRRAPPRSPLREMSLLMRTTSPVMNDGDGDRTTLPDASTTSRVTRGLTPRRARPLHVYAECVAGRELPLQRWCERKRRCHGRHVRGPLRGRTAPRRKGDVSAVGIPDHQSAQRRRRLGSPAPRPDR